MPFIKNLSNGVLSSIVIATLVSCGGGGNSNEALPTNGTDLGNNSNISLPDNDIPMVYPLQAIPLVVPGVATDSTKYFDFRYIDVSGNVIATTLVPGIAIEDGLLLAIVPQGVSNTRGEQVFGKAEIFLDGQGPITKLFVVDQPKLQNATNGLVLAGTLQAALDASIELQENLDEIRLEGFISTNDYQNLTTAEQHKRTLYRAQINEYITQGTITIAELDVLGEIQPIRTLSNVELNRADRSIIMSFAVMDILFTSENTGSTSSDTSTAIARRDGFARELDSAQIEFLRERYRFISESLADTLHATQAGDAPSSVKDTVEGLADWIPTVIPAIENATQQGLDKAQQLLASIGLIVSGGGVILSDGSAIGNASIELAKLLSQTTTLPAVLLINRLTNSNTDAFLQRDKNRFDWTAELVGQIARTGSSVLGALPAGVISGMSNLTGQALEIKDTFVNIQTLACTKNKNNFQRSELFQNSTNVGRRIADLDSFCSSTVPETASNTHACADPQIQIDAHWKFFRNIFGGGFTSFPEKHNLVCFGDFTYFTYLGSSLDEYVCDTDWSNCQRSGNPPTIYTDIVQHDGWTQYVWEGGWGDRTPAQ